MTFSIAGEVLQDGAQHRNILLQVYAKVVRMPVQVKDFSRHRRPPQQRCEPLNAQRLEPTLER
jgi:hypothetical protein